jgi:hypothetical protein
MTEAFGPEGLILLDVTQARERGLSDADARILSEVGLPVRADEAFTADIADELRTGSLVVCETGHGDVDILILGGVPGGRYFLDLRSGAVGLLSLDGEPQAEQINSSLESFVAFLHGIRLRQAALQAAPGEDALRRRTEELGEVLQELDPVAFRDAEAWWLTVLDHLMGRDYHAETRAFLEQRRAEVAGPSSGQATTADLGDLGDLLELGSLLDLLGAGGTEGAEDAEDAEDTEDAEGAEDAHGAERHRGGPEGHHDPE